jgi:hypothetical protein
MLTELIDCVSVLYYRHLLESVEGLQCQPGTISFGKIAPRSKQRLVNTRPAVQEIPCVRKGPPLDPTLS